MGAGAARPLPKGTINGCSCETTTINAGRVHEVFWPKLRELLVCPDLVDRLYTVTQRFCGVRRGGRSKTVTLTSRSRN